MRPDILELGSGAGGPPTSMLAGRGRLTGVDISIEQVRLASSKVPNGRFIRGDLTKIDFPAGSFDAVSMRPRSRSRRWGRRAANSPQRPPT